MTKWKRFYRFEIITEPWYTNRIQWLKDMKHSHRILNLMVCRFGIFLYFYVKHQPVLLKYKMKTKVNKNNCILWEVTAVLPMDAIVLGLVVAIQSPRANTFKNLLCWSVNLSTFTKPASFVSSFSSINIWGAVCGGTACRMEYWSMIEKGDD